MNTVIRPFAAGELDELAQLAQRLQARRETSSTFCCAKAADIRRDFAQTMEYGFACWADGRPLGLVSCFPDPEKGNADCSLLLDVQGAAYRDLAKALLAAAREKLGPELACTFFFPMENEDCRGFLELAGARRQVNEYILSLAREDWTAPSHPAVRPHPLREEELDAFSTLHDAVFPGVYASGQDILADLGESRFVYVIPGGDSPAAYGVLKIQGGAQATAEMLAVRPDARRRGYGRAILNHLAREAFTRFRAQRLELVVDADNRSALGLYLNTGFHIRQENNCYILR